MTATLTRTEHVSVQQVREMIDTDPSVRIIDVRTGGEFETMHIPGSFNIPLDTLNERQRMALLLNKFEHMSYQDIAASMDLSVQAVKSLLTRARENLKTKLEPFL